MSDRITKILSIWQALRSSLWFVPGTIVLLAVGLAIALIEADTHIDSHVFDDWPRLFGAGAAGSRGMLMAVASSMITVAGVVFSITLVALSLASTQYTSRVLRNFMSDRTNQSVLGVFVGIFAYCLVVLRTIRDDEVDAFVPSLAVLGGVVLAFVGIGYFIYFIHHIATSIQASHILARIASETLRGVEHLFPEGVGCEDDRSSDREPPHSDLSRLWRPIPAHKIGYIQRVDVDALLSIARDQSAVVRMERRIGDFAILGCPLASMLSAHEPTAELSERVSAVFTINHQRTTDQDAAYGIRQIVDIALKALSPGVNDTTTAVMSLDYLAAILVKLSDRRIESPCRLDKGELRVITLGATFADMVALSLDQIRQNAAGNIAVILRVLETLETLQERVETSKRRRALLFQVRAIEELIDRTVPAPLDREPLAMRAGRLASLLCDHVTPPDSTRALE